MNRLGTAAFALMCSLPAWPNVTLAQDAAPPDAALAEIREMTLYARYREAKSAVIAFLARTDLDAIQRNTGLEVLATIHVAMRETSDARQVLERLYARDPGHTLSDPDASPPVVAAFGRARTNAPAPIAVGLEHRPPSLTTRRPPTLEVRLAENADAIAELRLHYRQGDDRSFTTVVMNVGADGVANARLPLLDSSGAYDVEYFVEAHAPSDHVLARQGDRDTPLRFTVPAAPALAVVATDEERPAVANGGDDLWWVWVIAGAVVVAGGVVGGYFIAQEVTTPDDGSLGNVELPLVRF